VGFVYLGRALKLPDELRAQLRTAAMGQPPMLRPHPLKGGRKGEIATDILGKTHPWRIVFKVKSGKFLDVKIENYH
jgi:hypothetical protein